jgi:membrane associated rhomboid family serine protease
MKQKNHPFGSSFEAFFYPTMLLIVLWLVYWADHLFKIDLYKFGVLPKSLEGLKGILLMPFIHSKNEIQHIVNNSAPTFFLLAALIYFYREIALRVFVVGWLTTGLLLWIYADNTGAYHIGISGLIYMLAGFLFASGAMRRFLPLQAISLFVVFFYGSMIWGIFPMQQKVSWEGHLMGLVVGVALAFVYRSHGPQRPKFQYEIEKEMGIEPPDLEAIYNENLRLAKEAEEERLRQAQGYIITYHYVPTNPESKPTDDKNQQ